MIPPVEIRPPAFEIISAADFEIQRTSADRAGSATGPAAGKGKPPRPGKLPRIAIIIDDIGYDAQIAEKFIGLNAAITLSILPHSPHQREIVRMAREKGLDLMLHLPMEPLEYPAVNPGPGALLTAHDARCADPSAQRRPGCRSLHQRGQQPHGVQDDGLVGSDEPDLIQHQEAGSVLYRQPDHDRQPRPARPPGCFRCPMPNATCFWTMFRNPRRFAGSSGCCCRKPRPTVRPWPSGIPMP